MHVLFWIVLVLHLLGMLGMVGTASVQLYRFPVGPLKKLKWAWLPTVGTTMVTGLLLWPVALGAAMPVDALKTSVKIVVAAMSVAVAVRYHAKEVEHTPRWVPSSLAFFVGTEVVISLVW